MLADALHAGNQRVRPSPLEPPEPELMLLQRQKARRSLLKTNAGASIVDLGDGVLAVEFHPTLPVMASAGADGSVKLYASS